jgi:hypothetical protein
LSMVDVLSGAAISLHRLQKRRSGTPTDLHTFPAAEPAGQIVDERRPRMRRSRQIHLARRPAARALDLQPAISSTPVAVRIAGRLSVVVRIGIAPLRANPWAPPSVPCCYHRGGIRNRRGWLFPRPATPSKAGRSRCVLDARLVASVELEFLAQELKQLLRRVLRMSDDGPIDVAHDLRVLGRILRGAHSGIRRNQW